MRSLIASTGNSAVERNVSRSDMDKIHVVMAEMPKLVEIFDNLARLNSLYDNTDNLTQLNDIYLDIAAIIPKVNAIYPRLSSIEYVEAHTEQLLGLEQIATTVAAYASNVELNANDVLTRTTRMDKQYLDIQTKYGAMVSYMDTVSATAIDIIERENLITTMYDYVLQSSTYINSVLDDIVGVETVATNIHNDKLAISADVATNELIKAAVKFMHNDIQDIENRLKDLKDEIIMKHNNVVISAGEVQSNRDIVSNMCNFIVNAKDLVCRDAHDVSCMVSAPKDFKYTLCTGSTGYSAQHYMLKAKEYAEATGASVGDFTTHTSRCDNPHNVTKEQLGLGRVENIAPINMNVNSATHLAIPRTIKLTGDVLGSVNFDGKSNVCMATTIAMKTINGQSLLGTGNIIITGGSGGSGSNNWYDLINVPTTLTGYGITDVYDKATVDLKFTTKQEKLVSGTNIKTIMGQQLLGSGEITLSVPFSSIVSTPTTLSGYGITNAYTKTEANNIMSTLLSSKVDAVAGKGLSSEDFTYDLKTKLENSAAYVHPTSTAVGTFNQVTVDGKGHVTSGSVVTNIADLGITNVYDKTTINSLLADKVSSVIGKGLSTNDFTNEYKIKLDNSIAYVHPTSTVSPGVYTKVTVDSNGHIVSAENPTSLSGYNISDAMSTSHSANAITGLGSSGSSTQVARADHTHASDSTKVNKTDSIFIGSTSVPLNALSGDVDELVVDIDGNASTATKLKTAVTINDIDFDGSTNIVIVDATKQPLDADLTHISSFTTGSYGVLKRLADDTWELDNSIESISSISGSGAIEVSDNTNKVISIKPASSLTAGSMSIADKNKLDTIATNANNYVHPDSPVIAGEYSLVTVDETGHIISATKPTTLTGLGITGIYTAEDVDLILADYQSKLLSGSNVKTINGQSILGSGNLVVTTDVSTIPFSSLINTPTTLSGYGITDAYTKTEVDTRALQKQDVLYSGVNIKTVNGQSLIGGGNINIASGVTSVAGRTGAITLTKNDVGLDLVTNISDGSRNVLSATKLTTARNINGVPFDGTNDITINSTDSTKEPIIPSGTIAQYYRGDKTWAAMPTSLPASDVYAWAKAATKPSYTYSEISGTPSIPAAQVQSDWNAVSGMGVILNKPTLFSGSYSDLTNKPTIPTVPINVSAFTNDSGYITNAYHDDTKQDLLVAGTNIKTINGSSILGSGDLVITASGVAWGSVTGTISSQTDLQTCFNAKQNTLVSGTSIKTINGNSLLGSGNIVVSYSESIATPIASAATTSISAAGGKSVHITGTTTITSLGTGTTGQTVKVIFDDALVLTHNTTSLMNISNANITTAAGDTAVFLNENGASGYWRMLSYTRKDGTALVPPTSVTTATNATNATNATITKCIVNTVSTCRNDGIPVVSATCNCFTSCLNSPGSIHALYSVCLTSATGCSSVLTRVTSTGSFAIKCNYITTTATAYPAIYRSTSYANASNASACSIIESCSSMTSVSSCSELKSVSSYYVGTYSAVSGIHVATNSTGGSSCVSLYSTSVASGHSCMRISAVRNSSCSNVAATSVMIIESTNVYDSTASYSDKECISINTSNLKLLRIPSIDPHIIGVLWNNNGVINISAG